MDCGSIPAGRDRHHNVPNLASSCRIFADPFGISCFFTLQPDLNNANATVRWILACRRSRGWQHHTRVKIPGLQISPAAPRQSPEKGAISGASAGPWMDPLKRRRYYIRGTAKLMSPGQCRSIYTIVFPAQYCYNKIKKHQTRIPGNIFRVYSHKRDG